MVSLVFLNLFIAIILEGFETTSTEESMRIGFGAIESFQRHWTKYDPTASGVTNVADLEKIIMDLIVEEMELKKKDRNIKGSGF